MSKIVDVVAGALIGADGRFLLGSRPDGKPYAGYWEFPGGKIEPGETPQAALARELHEEMGITVRHATPWMTKHYVYEHATVFLRFFRVWAWDGELVAREGQSFSWQTPGVLSVEPMLPANGPVLRALAVPQLVSITCAHELEEAAVLNALSASTTARWVIVREPQMDRAQLVAFVEQVAARVHAKGGKVIVNADPAWLAGLPVDGVHLTSARLAEATERPAFDWVGASIHSAAELEQAAALGCDYALLGHVKPTASHPDRAPLGWDGFTRLLADGTPIPVLALGGLGVDDLLDARAHGAHGVALMRGAWR